MCACDQVPLLRRSFALFSELEVASGEKLFEQTGSMDIGPENEATFAGSRLSCETHQLPHQVCLLLWFTLDRCNTLGECCYSSQQVLFVQHIL